MPAEHRQPYACRHRSVTMMCERNHRCTTGPSTSTRLTCPPAAMNSPQQRLSSGRHGLGRPHSIQQTPWSARLDLSLLSCTMSWALLPFGMVMSEQPPTAHTASISGVQLQGYLLRWQVAAHTIQLCAPPGCSPCGGPHTCTVGPTTTTTHIPTQPHCCGSSAARR